MLQIREKLLASVDPINSLEGKTVTGGRLNAATAVADMGTFGASGWDHGDFHVNPPSGSMLMAG